jgi:hypothetical protein
MAKTIKLFSLAVRAKSRTYAAKSGRHFWVMTISLSTTGGGKSVARGFYLAVPLSKPLPLY